MSCVLSGDPTQLETDVDVAVNPCECHSVGAGSRGRLKWLLTETSATMQQLGLWRTAPVILGCQVHLWQSRGCWSAVHSHTLALQHRGRGCAFGCESQAATVVGVESSEPTFCPVPHAQHGVMQGDDTCSPVHQPTDDSGWWGGPLSGMWQPGLEAVVWVPRFQEWSVSCDCHQ